MSVEMNIAFLTTVIALVAVGLCVALASICNQLERIANALEQAETQEPASPQTRKE